MSRQSAALLKEEHHTEPVTTSIRLSGLDCADCAAKLERKIILIDGVQSVKMNFGASKMVVEHTVPLDKIIRFVDAAGYGAETEGPAGKKAEKPQLSYWVRNKRSILTIISGIFVGAGFILSLLKAPDTIIIPLYITGMISGGFYVARSGLTALRTLSLDMNFLMTVAAVGAVAIGEWTEGATVVFLFSLGNTLQAYTMEKTRNSIRALMDLSPKEAMVVRDGREVRMPVEEIKKGDIIIIRPGERIAMDGRVTAGSSAVNQAPITGESIPVTKEPGSEVFAGTINGRGSLEVEVTRLVSDNTLARIIHLVEEAQAQKAPSQHFVDVFAKYYTPSVITAAVAIAVLPALFFGQPFIPWFKKALILLVISCPCALVISTPVAIVTGIGTAAKNGVLIKGGAYLEKAGALKVIAFDKTGTLTAGRPLVTDLVPVNNFSREELIRIAASVEARSEHPLAEAILRHAAGLGTAITPASDFTAFTGKGARAIVDGIKYTIGSARMMEEAGIDIRPVEPALTELQAQGKTVVILAGAGNIVGVIAIADKVRDNSRAAIQGLRSTGIKKIIMLTGDTPQTARAIAGELGVDGYEAGLLPEDKLTIVRKLLAKYDKVAMVGDGVNDAPALAASTVGIAMGGAGTDTALETADIVLMGDDLSKLPYTMELSRRALRIIKENIFFSLVLKGAFIVLTFLGMANLWMAVFADTGAALLVIANGLRLMKGKLRSA
jgi:Cd2+/Zn2+-exporting ATPase